MPLQFIRISGEVLLDSCGTGLGVSNMKSEGLELGHEQMGEVECKERETSVP